MYKHTKTNLNSAWREAEPLLNHCSELSDSATFLSKNILGPGCQYNDFSPCRSHPDFNTTISILRKLFGKEVVEFSFENAICNELQWRVGDRHFGTK